MNEEEYWSMRLSNDTFHGNNNKRIILDYLIAPSVIYKPKIYIDGNEWCTLYGENLQDGVCGFGKSPELAMNNFDKAWIIKIQ